MTYVTTLTSLARDVHANRILAGVRIPHPVSNPTVGPERELRVRRAFAQRALQILATPVEGPTVFTVDHPGAR